MLLIISVGSYPPEKQLTVSFWGILTDTPWLSESKQLLDNVEHDIVKYQHLGLSYTPKPKAEADNADMKFDIMLKKGIQ